jgi:hypothetical protein
LIWSAIYGSAFTYFLPNKSTAFDDNFSALLAYITANSGTSSYATLDPDPANCYTYGCPTPNQHLGYAVPSPLAGAGLPGLLAACGVLSLLARRRRRAIA